MGTRARTVTKDGNRRAFSAPVAWQFPDSPDSTAYPFKQHSPFGTLAIVPSRISSLSASTTTLAPRAHCVMDFGRRRLAGLDDLGAQAIFPQREYHVANLVMITVGGSDGNEFSQDIWCFNLGASRCLSSPSVLSSHEETYQAMAVWIQIT